MMSALCASGAGAGRRVLFVKGAPESVLERCSGALTNEGSGAVEAMTPGLRSALHAKVGQAAAAGAAAARCGSAGRRGGGGVAALPLAAPLAPEGCSHSPKSQLAGSTRDLHRTGPTSPCLPAYLPAWTGGRVRQRLGSAGAGACVPHLARGRPLRCAPGRRAGTHLHRPGGHAGRLNCAAQTGGHRKPPRGCLATACWRWANWRMGRARPPLVAAFPAERYLCLCARACCLPACLPACAGPAAPRGAQRG